MSPAFLAQAQTRTHAFDLAEIAVTRRLRLTGHQCWHLALFQGYSKKCSGQCCLILQQLDWGRAQNHKWCVGKDVKVTQPGARPLADGFASFG